MSDETSEGSYSEHRPPQQPRGLRLTQVIGEERQGGRPDPVGSREVQRVERTDAEGHREVGSPNAGRFVELDYAVGELDHDHRRVHGRQAR